MADMPSVFPSFDLSMSNTTSTIIMYAIIFAPIAALIGYWWWKKKTYKHTAVIMENRNGQLVELKVAFRYKVINNTDCVKMWGVKKFLDKPGQDFIKRINGRDVIYYQKGNDNYIYPTKIELADDNSPGVKQRVAKTDADFWASYRTRLEIARWANKSMWEQYAVPIAMVIMAMIFIIGNWIIWNGIQGAVAPIGNAAGELSKTNLILADMLNDSRFINKTAPQSQQPGIIFVNPTGSGGTGR